MSRSADTGNSQFDRSGLGGNLMRTLTRSMKKTDNKIIAVEFTVLSYEKSRQWESRRDTPEDDMCPSEVGSELGSDCRRPRHFGLNRLA